MKKPLIILGLSAATVAALAVLTGAFGTKTTASQISLCNDGTGKILKIAQLSVTSGHLSAKNPCNEWFDMVAHDPLGGSIDIGYALAPGAHFDWAPKQAFAPYWSHLVEADACTSGTVKYYRVYSDNDVRPAPACTSP